MARPRKTTRRKSPRKKRQPKRILNVEPSPKTDEDWTFQTAQDADMVMAAPSIPASKDLRAAWWKVADQGSTGSCVGWATADSVLRWHFVKNGRIAQEDLLSPRFIWMASKETDPFSSRPTTFIDAEGTSLKAALDIARKFGAVRDRILPFRTGRLYGGQANTFYAVAAQLKILAYFNLGTNQTNWRIWLATKGPILTRLNVDDAWYDATVNRGDLDEYQADTARGGHAVAIVGYRAGRFIVRNSWGTGWGDGGFAYASLGYAEQAFTEAYGVQA
ncbi:MAG TPA: C1 family peptidase [Gaiellaceae bacterium]|nr:C1 family peptidase [Gaiellaceae bacterium]